MTSPRRRPIPLTGITTELEDLARTIKRDLLDIAAGWSTLKADLHTTGWPDRTPEDDRNDRDAARRNNPDREPTGEDNRDTLDYADPTGDAAGQLWDRHGDLEALQDHLHAITTSWKALTIIATRHRPLSGGIPECSISVCNSPVEHTGNGRGFVGCIQICGVWYAKVGARPTCREHRDKRRNEPGTDERTRDVG